jgi:hypothetical protein
MWCRVGQIGRELGVAPAEVDDLVQLTFLDVPRAALRFDDRWPLRNWLLGLAAVVVPPAPPIAGANRSAARGVARELA